MATFNDLAVLRLNQIVQTPKNPNPLVPVSKATWWRWVKEGTAPKPIKLGEKTTVWKVSDIKAFLTEKGLN